MRKWVRDDVKQAYYTDIDGVFFTAVPYKRKNLTRFAIQKMTSKKYQLIGTVRASLIWKKQATALVKKFMNEN